MHKVLGLITARGGSKGLPGKNIKLLDGVPLIGHTIKSALESRAFDRLILSCDDQKIIEVAESFGCEAPFVRPAEFATDTATHLSVLAHAVNWLTSNQQYQPDYVMILQPTAPLRQAFHICEAIELIASTGADSVISVVEVPKPYNPFNQMIKDREGRLRLCFTDQPIYRRTGRRQEYPTTYHSVGLIYLFKSSLLTQPEPNLYGEATLPYLIDEKYIADIDTLSDWKVAEQKLEALKGDTIERAVS